MLFRSNLFQDTVGCEVLVPEINQFESTAPNQMKSLAVQYFDWIIKGVSGSFDVTFRQLALWKSQCGGHSQDWLFSIPIPTLQQSMNGIMYSAVLRYKLGIAMFDGAKICPACGKAAMDRWGDHAGSLC